VGRVVRTGGEKYIYRILVGKPVGRRQVGRTRHRWESNIEVDHKQNGMV
jgi:hypothetical protein